MRISYWSSDVCSSDLLVKDASALGFSVTQLRRHHPEAVQGALRELLAWVAEGRLRPLVSSTVPFEEFADAMRLLRDRRSTRSEERRVGQECVSRCSLRWRPLH